MNSIPTFKLSRLRKIGWSHWDPIGTNDLNDRPDDEYDSYLMTAAARLWRGESVEDVGAYLVDIEVNYIGLSSQPNTKSRASKTAGAISDYIFELRN
ncbi:MAG TPA: hypothetical protein VLA45_04170 [Paracoccaceae bacterium]|nr:hypothetical protein [Paracoccaceae bacterium]